MALTLRSITLRGRRRVLWLRLIAMLLFVTPLFASAVAHEARAQERQSSSADAPTPPSATSTAAVPLPPEYVIGPGDVLSIRFWRRDEVSADVVVRPDGRISLLLLDDIDAAGVTPEALRDRIVAKAGTLFEDPRVTVVVKEVHSRTVYITGLVAKPGPYPLTGRLTVLQLIALAGGLLDWANGSDIVIMRHVNGTEVGYEFNYDDAKNLKHLERNIELQPGDTVIVP